MTDLGDRGSNEEEIVTRAINQPTPSSRKRKNNSTSVNNPSKRVKKPVKNEDSRMLKRLVREMSTVSPRTSDLKEREALERASKLGKGLEKRLVQYNHLEEHEARKKINIEVKDQLPKEVSKAAVRKKIERARKIYDLFFRITDDKNQRIEYIKRIKTFTASSISKLSSENIEYVASQVRMNTNDFK
ncbi:452_t:CDS:2 [Rhizophagus irregularis]|nr:452_t:CDS:2 [Rhizophagus irregularis]